MARGEQQPGKVWFEPAPRLAYLCGMESPETPETPAPETEEPEAEDIASPDEPAGAPAPGAKLSGLDVIKDNLKRLPGKPGVYRMFGDKAELLYVGKARNLKARVSSYAKLGGHTQRIARMISLTRSMEFVVTASETEALLLEANLIKRLKPRFNLIL